MKQVFISMLLIFATLTTAQAAFNEPPKHTVAITMEKLSALQKKNPKKFARKMQKVIALLKSPAKLARLEKAVRWSNSRQTDLGRLAGAVLIGLLTLAALAIFVLEAMFATPISAVICTVLIGAGITATYCCLTN